MKRFFFFLLLITFNSTYNSTVRRTIHDIIRTLSFIISIVVETLSMFNVGHNATVIVNVIYVGTPHNAIARGVKRKLDKKKKKVI